MQSRHGPSKEDGAGFSCNVIQDNQLGPHLATGHSLSTPELKQMSVTLWPSEHPVPGKYYIGPFNLKPPPLTLEPAHSTKYSTTYSGFIKGTE